MLGLGGIGAPIEPFSTRLLDFWVMSKKMRSRSADFARRFFTTLTRLSTCRTLPGRGWREVKEVVKVQRNAREGRDGKGSIAMLCQHFHVTRNRCMLALVSRRPLVSQVHKSHNVEGAFDLLKRHSGIGD